MTTKNPQKTTRKASDELEEMKVSDVEEEKKLNLTYDELLMILDHSHDEIYVTDANGKVLYVNGACERHYGARPEEVIGHTPEEISDKGYWTPRISSIALDKRTSITLEQKTCLGKTLLTTATPVYDDNGNIKMIIENSRDITESKGIRHELDISLKKLAQYKTEVEELRKQDSDIVYKSKAMSNLMALARRVSEINSTVLILGESGTGKGVIAKYIHNSGSHKDGPFVSINCAAIPSELMESELFGYSAGSFTGASGKGRIGLFELADGGTLFLDEIAEIPLHLQAKLLHALQEKVYFPVGGRKEKKVNCRILAATNKDLQAMVMKQAFRDDLYYRLNVFEITIPPLRDRTDDIGPLVNYLINRYNDRYDLHRQISHRALEALIKYPWPGNVREMENTLERLVVMTPEDLIDIDHLPDSLRYESATEMFPLLNKGSLDEALEEVERKIILQSYEKYGSSYEVARKLKISQSKASRLIRRYYGSVKDKKSNGNNAVTQ
ncbi:MAG: sigma 54-interacting transcriptional regulator [Bacillota bacterium]|nr:sigma 54-interacting transcriptional regulator [Bacillota bacterium]